MTKCFTAEGIHYAYVFANLHNMHYFHKTLFFYPLTIYDN